MNDFKILKEKYPHITALPAVAYKEQKNRTRRMRLFLLLAVMRNSEDFRKLSINDEYKCIVVIENSCYENTIIKCKEENIECSWTNSDMVNTYAHTMFILLTELDVNNNTYLLPHILKNSININQVGSMSQEEMNPFKTRQYESIIKERREVVLHEVFSYIYVCPACGVSKARETGGQLASLDEQQATMLECVNCLNRWTTYS